MQSKRSNVFFLVAVVYGSLLAVSNAQLPIFEISRGEDNTIRFTWTAISNATGYRVEYKDNLSPGSNWLPCALQDQWPITETHWVDDSLNSQNKFYRLCVYFEKRGALISSTPMASYTASQLSFYFPLLGIPISPQYSVSAYRVLYKTISADGSPCVASGTIIIPESQNTKWPLLSYQHGTILKTNDAPSFGSGEFFVGVAWATSGYLTCIPDYLGLGLSQGLHPYIHARSEATASVDLLQACLEFCKSRNIQLNGQLFLVGYSQGGHATMALHRELESYFTNQFTVTASAPMAGPYDLSGTMAEIMTSNKSYPSPSYLAYLIFAYNYVYRLFNEAGEIFKEPYATQLPPMFNGNHSTDEIDRLLPSVPVEMLKDDFVTSFKNDPNNNIMKVLKRNDLCYWRPIAPVTLFHCKGDSTVPYKNSEIALAGMIQSGATNVTLVDPSPTSDHGSGALPSFLAAKTWFDSLKK